MPVTQYLEQARACAELADRSPPNDRKKILEIAETWLKLADSAAKDAAKSNENSANVKR
jgi:hypothetical protein